MLPRACIYQSGAAQTNYEQMNSKLIWCTKIKWCKLLQPLNRKKRDRNLQLLSKVSNSHIEKKEGPWNIYPASRMCVGSEEEDKGHQIPQTPNLKL
jgi:hypothetical protein